MNLFNKPRKHYCPYCGTLLRVVSCYEIDSSGEIITPLKATHVCANHQPIIYFVEVPIQEKKNDGDFRQI